MVVSTAVGGVPEVLPEDMTLLSETNSASIIEKLREAIEAKIVEKRKCKRDPSYKKVVFNKMV